jgi:glycosyltransferase involved in cell wall biosynthesis
MRKLLPFDSRRLVKWVLNFGRNSYLVQERIQREAIAGGNVVVAVSKNLANSYGLSNVRVIPIGIDSELFKPLENQEALREKHGIPKDKKVKIFVGSVHSVKGFDILKKEIKKDKESFYIIVLKDKHVLSINFHNSKVFQRIPQSVLAELYNCADVFVGRSRVETSWLAPIEAMFCGVPVDVTPVGIFADWKPANKNPRQEAFAAGLDKETMIKRWRELLRELI